jgi:hypothetical protein
VEYSSSSRPKAGQYAFYKGRTSYVCPVRMANQMHLRVTLAKTMTSEPIMYATNIKEIYTTLTQNQSQNRRHQNSEHICSIILILGDNMSLDIVETKPFLAKDNQSSAEDIKTQNMFGL